MSDPKLSPDSLLRESDQERLYREQMGHEALERQKEAARRARRTSCTCQPHKIKVEDGHGHKTLHTVHRRDCPKFKPWMEDL